MATFVLFWSLTLTIILFLICMFFKLLMSAFNALAVSIGTILVIAGAILGVELVAFILYTIVYNIMAGQLGAMLLTLFFTIVVLIIGFYIVGWFGVAILAVVLGAATFALEFLVATCQLCSEFFEDKYLKYLTVVTSQLGIR